VLALGGLANVAWLVASPGHRQLGYSEEEFTGGNMAELSYEEVVGILGGLGDVIIAEVIATGITKEEHGRRPKAHWWPSQRRLHLALA
jgi:hypothetical protein